MSPIFFFLFGVFQRVRRNSVAPLEVSYAESATVTARLTERMIFSMSTPFRDDDPIGMSPVVRERMRRRRLVVAVRKEENRKQRKNGNQRKC